MNSQTSLKRICRSFLFVTALWLSSPGAQAATPEFAVRATPAWVIAIAPQFDAKVPLDQISSGVHHLLFDVQHRNDAKQQLIYRHRAITAINQKGLEYLGQIEIRFNPAFQFLELHSLTVHRQGRQIDKLKAASIKILQREKELEYLIFDGSKTANIVLDDLQVGDTVEYAYSLRGENPALAGMRSGRFDMQWSVPLHQLHASLEVPTSRPVHFKLRNRASEPVVTESAGMRRYVWTGKNLPPLVDDRNTPHAYDPVPSVEWSDFADWNMVARWAAPLYSLPKKSAAVSQAAESIRAESSTVELQVINALRRVQRDVRYLAIAVGSGSFVPNPPDQVLKRRFGDCKDKSLLLVALLRELGIESFPALVNSESRSGITSSQPSPNAFDHVIVRVRLNDRTYWLDPTRNAQGGTLDIVQQADFGHALIIDAGTRDLVEMFPDASKKPWERRSVATVYDNRAGTKAPVKYSVVTTFEGRAADGIRNALNEISQREKQKQYLSYYDFYFPGIQATEQFAVEDFFDKNLVIVREAYEIPTFWQQESGSNRLQASVRTPDLESLLEAPRNMQRVSPLAITHPLELVHTTDVLLPDSITVQNSTEKIVGPSFSLERKVEAMRGNRIVLRDHFQSTASEIAVSALPEYSTKLAAARKATSFAFWRYDDGATSGRIWPQVNSLVALTAIVIIVFWLVFAVRVYRWNPVPDRRSRDASLDGIRGWLIVSALVMLLSLARICMGLWEIAPAYTAASWEAITDPEGGNYSVLQAPLLIAELFGNIGLLTFSTLLLVLFFMKRSSFPVLYILVVWGNVGFVFADLLISAQLPASALQSSVKDWQLLSSAVVGSLIWSAYYRRSVRVRSTFTQVYTPAHTPPINLATPSS